MHTHASIYSTYSLIVDLVDQTHHGPFSCAVLNQFRRKVKMLCARAAPTVCVRVYYAIYVRYVCTSRLNNKQKKTLTVYSL